jgi:hypothetical protein
MAQESIKTGATSQSILVFIQSTVSTTGGGLTGLTYNTSGLTAYYSFAGPSAASTAITLATLATAGAAWSTGGFVQLDSTNMPGWYRFDVPNAVIAGSSGRVVAVHFRGAANMAETPILIELTGWDNQDAVHGGMSALPNAAAAAAGGLPILGTNATAITFTSGLTISNTSGNALTLTSSGGNGTALSASGNGTGSGVLFAGGATGAAVNLTGGATSGAGVNITTTSGDGIDISPTAGHGINVTANGTNKHGIVATGGTAGNCQGMNLVGGTGGVGLVSPTITGNLNGSVSLVTGNVNGNVVGSVGSIAGVTFPTNFSSLVITGSGYVALAGPYKMNTAAGFEFSMVQSSDHATPYTGGSITAVRSIAGGAETAVSGTITQIASTNRYYFAGLAADFNGAEVGFCFSASGADSITITIATTP